MSLLVVSGSLSEKGRTAYLLRAAVQGFLAESPESRIEELNVARAGIEIMDGRPLDKYGEPTVAAIDQARAAAALLFGSPMYRGGTTGALKNYLDLVPPDAMRGKAAAIVATGASHHHYLGVSLSIEPVLKFFQMHLVPSHLYVANFDLDTKANDQRAALLGRALAVLARQSYSGALLAGPGIE